MCCSFTPRLTYYDFGISVCIVCGWTWQGTRTARDTISRRFTGHGSHSVYGYSRCCTTLQQRAHLQPSDIFFPRLRSCRLSDLPSRTENAAAGSGRSAWRFSSASENACVPQSCLVRNSPVSWAPGCLGWLRLLSLLSDRPLALTRCCP